jgi:hypothetical protein
VAITYIVFESIAINLDPKVETKISSPFLDHSTSYMTLVSSFNFLSGLSFLDVSQNISSPSYPAEEIILLVSLNLTLYTLLVCAINLCPGEFFLESQRSTLLSGLPETKRFPSVE